MSTIYSVYIAYCSDGTLYTGIATDVWRRIAQHNDGHGSKYCRSRRPVRLAYVERSVGPLRIALRRERIIKRMTTEAKWKMVHAYQRDPKAERKPPH